MNKVINYKKQIVTMIITIVVSVILFGAYILHTTLNNTNYSKSEAHVIALKYFPGTIITSEIEYDKMQIFYELEVENQQQERIKITISAKTGKIIEYEYKE